MIYICPSNLFIFIVEGGIDGWVGEEEGIVGGKRWLCRNRCK